MNVDAGILSQQVLQSETDGDAGAASAGFVFAGLARASILWFKKSMIMIPIKKQAFLQIGRLTHTSRSSVTATGTTTTTTDRVTSQSKPLLFPRGLAKELAKSAVLGITVFGTYEYLVQSYNMTVDNGDTNAQSTVLVHIGAGACAGLVQSSVLTTWEVTSKLTSHHGITPHNWRGPFLARRAVHHAVGYASLFGTFEATRRVLLYCSMHLVPFEETHPRVTSLATTFLAGGFAGQVHHFVNYVTSHWKLQRSTSDLRKHAQQYSRHPNRRANLAAFGPTALCFVAFHFGEELTEQMCGN